MQVSTTAAVAADHYGKPTPTIIVLADGETRWKGERLFHSGFRVLMASCLEDVRAIAEAGEADAAIVHVMDEDEGRLDLVAQLRGEIGVIVVSGAVAESGERSRIVALMAGADDVLPEQFAYEELLWRVRALVRRRPARERTLTVGRLEVDVQAHEVRLGGRPIAVTRVEFKLLVVLARDPRRVRTREELLAFIWGAGAASFARARTLDTHACRLRRKLASNGDSFVVAVWGVGYRLL